MSGKNPTHIKIVQSGKTTKAVVPTGVKYIAVPDRQKKVLNPAYQPSPNRGNTAWNNYVATHSAKYKGTGIDAGTRMRQLYAEYKASSSYVPPKPKKGNQYAGVASLFG